jgi:hypothetical protein
MLVPVGSVCAAATRRAILTRAVGTRAREAWTLAIATIETRLIETTTFAAGRTAITVAGRTALLPWLIVTAILTAAEIPARTTVRRAACRPIVAVETRAVVTLRTIITIEASRT